MVSLASMFVGTFVFTLCAGVVLPAGWQLARQDGQRRFFGTARPRRAVSELLILALLPAVPLLLLVFLARGSHAAADRGAPAILLDLFALVAPAYSVLVPPLWLAFRLAPPAAAAPRPALVAYARATAALGAVVFAAAVLLFVVPPVWIGNTAAGAGGPLPGALAFALFLSFSAAVVFALSRGSIELVRFITRRQFRPVANPVSGAPARTEVRDSSWYYPALLALGCFALALWLGSAVLRLGFPRLAYLPPVYSHPPAGTFSPAPAGAMTTFFERPPWMAITAALPGLLILLAGLLIALRFRPAEPAARVFTLLCTLYGLAWVPAFPRWGGPFFYGASFLAKTFFLPALLQFCLIFPRQEEAITGEAARGWPWLRAALYLPFVLLAPLWLWLQMHVGAMIERLMALSQGQEFAPGDLPAICAGALGGGTDLLLRSTVWVIGGYALVRTGWELGRARPSLSAPEAARAGAVHAQLKWVAAGGAIASSVYLFGTLLLFPLALPHLGSAWGDTILGFSILAFPLGTAVAVLFYDLWDVDRLIRGALVYGSLTLLLSALFMLTLIGGSVVLQRGSLLPPLLSFLLSAALMIPTRDWLQRAVDHMLGRSTEEFRHQQAELARLLCACPGSAELTQLLTETVPQRLRLTGAWLAPSPAQPPKQAAQALRQAGAALVLPLAVGDKPLGWYGVGPKWWGLPLNREEQELMRALAAQAAVAMALVAEHEERDRISLGIHHRVLSELTGATIWLQELEPHVEPQSEEARHALSAVSNAIRACMANLRLTMVRLDPDTSGPPLIEALKKAVDRFAGMGKFHGAFQAPADALPALSATLEETLVVIASEAAHNVIKHTDATMVTVALSCEGESGLRLVVEDDGPGFEPGRDVPGYGLKSMERLTRAAGGTLKISCPPPHGTRIEVSLPIEGGDDGNSHFASRGPSRDR